MFNILIADDHAMFRRGTRDLLIERYPSIVIGEAAGGDEMIRLAGKRRWDVFIMGHHDAGDIRDRFDCGITS